MFKSIYRRLRNLDVIKDLNAKIDLLQERMSFERLRDYELYQMLAEEKKIVEGRADRFKADLDDANAGLKIQSETINLLREENSKLKRENAALKSSAPTIKPVDPAALCGDCFHVFHLNGQGECASHGCGCKRKTAAKVEPS